MDGTCVDYIKNHPRDEAVVFTIYAQPHLASTWNPGPKNVSRNQNNIIGSQSYSVL